VSQIHIGTQERLIFPNFRASTDPNSFGIACCAKDECLKSWRWSPILEELPRNSDWWASEFETD
jgi:hypothetical protein